MLSFASLVFLITRVTTETPCRRKLTQAMTYHIFRNIYGDELFAVVYRKRMSYKIRSDHRSAAPCLDDLLLAALVKLIDFLL